MDTELKEHEQKIQDEVPVSQTQDMKEVFEQEQKKEPNGPFLSLSEISKIYTTDQDRFFGASVKLQTGISTIRSADAGKIVFIDFFDGSVVGVMRGITSFNSYQ